MPNTPARSPRRSSSSTRSAAARAQRPARTHGARRRRAARIQRHVCAGHARRRCPVEGHRAAVGPARASRPAPRAHAGVHRPRRRLARTCPRVRSAVQRAARARSRHRVRGARRRPGRRHRHLLDRREDRQVRACRAGGRSQLFSALRRRAAVSHRAAEAAAEDVGRAADARAQHRRGDDDPHERRGGARRARLRLDRRGFRRAACVVAGSGAQGARAPANGAPPQRRPAASGKSSSHPTSPA